MTTVLCGLIFSQLFQENGFYFQTAEKEVDADDEETEVKEVQKDKKKAPGELFYYANTHSMKTFPFNTMHSVKY